MNRNRRGLVTLAVAALWLSLAGLPGPAGAVLFRSLESPAPRPTGIATGDLDGDGRPDVVVGTDTGNQVAVLLNLRDGRLGFAETYVSGASPRQVAVADLDDDGDLDILAANRDDATLTVLWNDGDGTFQEVGTGAAVVPVGTRPRGMRLADLTGDGVPDVVVVHEVGQAGVLLNDGSGTLGAELALGFSSLGLDVADVNGDGDPDVVGTGLGLKVVLNDGAGGFGPPAEYPLGAGTRFSVALGDLNGDGHRDAVTTNTLPAEIQVAFNDGSGAFTAGAVYPVEAFPWDVRMTDLNHDGALDVAVVHGGDDGFASVLLGVGGGVLAALPAHRVKRVALELEVDDFDADGNPDLALARRPDVGDQGTVLLLLGDGTGDVGGEQRLDLPAGAEPRGVATRDLDRDGDPELVVADAGRSRFVVFTRGPDGLALDVEGGPGSLTDAAELALTDLDRDGDPEILLGSRLFFSVADNLGDGTFDAGRLDNIGTRSNALVVADFDEGLGPDVAFVWSIGSRGQLALAPNDGTGELDYAATPVIELPVSPEKIAAADVDLDGDVDIVTSHVGGELMLVENAGAGALAAPVSLGSFGSLSSVRLVDLNADLAPEVLVADKDADALLVLTNLGGGSFGVPLILDVGEEPFSIAAGDVDLDGDVDVAVVDQTGTLERVRLFLGDGLGGLTPAGDFALGGGAFELSMPFGDGKADLGDAIAMIDADQDGDLDLAVANPGEGSVSLLINRLIEPEFEGALLSAFTEVTTDTEGDGATPTDPVETTVRVAAVGAAQIREAPISVDPPRGFRFFGHEIQIDAPPASVASPTIVRFRLDAAHVPAGFNAFSVRVFRESLLVGACLGAPGAASPNPCVASRANLGDGDVELEVRTSLASRWNLGGAVPLGFVIAADFNTDLGPDRVIFDIPDWKWTLLIDQIADLDQDGSESMAAGAGAMEASAIGATLGNVAVRVRSLNAAPFQISGALLEEPFNQVPNLIELPPFAPSALGELNYLLYLEFDIPGVGRAHNETAFQAAGVFGGWPPFPDQRGFGNTAVPLVDEQGAPTGVTLTALNVAAGLQSPPPQVRELAWSADGRTLSWADDPNAESFRIYEGHRSGLAGLVGSAPDVCLKAAVALPQVSPLATIPAEGTLLFYLVTPVGPYEEGRGGRTSDGPRRIDSLGACGASCAHSKCATGVALEPSCDTCVATICAADPSCCTDGWDAQCVAHVRSVCGNLSCADSQGQCSHTLCEEGFALGNACDVPPLASSCVDAICAADDFCCGDTWDIFCVNAVSTVCGLNCG